VAAAGQFDHKIGRESEAVGETARLPGGDDVVVSGYHDAQASWQSGGH
jgi:hypothetical protein